MLSHIRHVLACLAVNCHLRFWQNYRNLVRATAVTRGWNGYRNESAQKVDPGEEISPAFLQGLENPGPLNQESDALTTELSPLPKVIKHGA